MTPSRPWKLTFAAGVLLLLVALGQGLRSQASASQADAAVEVEGVVINSSGAPVLVRVLVDPGVADPEALVAERFPGISLTGGTVTAAYSVQGKWAASDIPVPVTYNPAGEPFSTQALVQWGIGIWNTAPGQSFRFADAGTTAISGSLCDNNTPPDGKNVVRFADLNPAFLGLTCAMPGGSIGGYTRIVEFDLELAKSPPSPWSIADVTPSNAYDLKTTVLHELGHGLGLSHSDVPGALMAASLAKGKQIRSPQPDDLAGLQALYGTGSPPPTQPPPSPTQPLPSPTQPPPAVTIEPTAVPTPSPTPTPQKHQVTIPSLARDP